MNKELDRDPIITQAEEEALQAIEEAGHDLLAVRAYRDNIGEEYTRLTEWEDWIGDYEEAYTGYTDAEDFAQDLAEELLSGESELAIRYFDYKLFERDLFLGDYWENDGYIFRSL